MIELSTKSLFFVLLLLLAPFVLRYRWKGRKTVFLILNIAVISLAAGSLMQLAITAVWILIPFLFVRFVKKQQKLQPVLIIWLIASFVYLAGYGFLFSVLHLDLILPFKILGLSYFLFREIDYVLQMPYLKEQGYACDLTDYLNYVLSFYTLLAGPILRYKAFADDFHKDEDQKGYIPIAKQELFTLINRVVNGYFKVYVISAILDHYARYWFDGLKSHSSMLHAIVAFCIFAFFNCWFIYFNFSGYCDIVIGASGLAGLEIHENFNRPYLSCNVIEFWNRHHITLSEWIRDYIFMPSYKLLLSGPLAKAAVAAQAIALFFTFFVAGIWHGTTIDYVMYGFFQGLGIVVSLLYREKRKKLLGKQKNKAYENNRAVIWITRIMTWSYISLTFSFTGYPVMPLFLR